MNSIYRWLYLTMCLTALLCGCKTSPQTIAYNSIYTVEKTTTAAFDSYIDCVIHGQCKTNGVPVVSKAFNTFQGAVKLAIDRAQGDKNAVAPTGLVTDGNNVLTLISTLK